ncbi:hypothetical protein BRE01_46380 [Brevibacillus reuszeri]|uniref:Uncharacterized protein n=1 Tax=Brevibacillus reuszeri TaxID=54915 RepID=A0A0K9YZC9_9BACL|nr:hypothetical protein [Brevibacillus reuszeri]KNB73977.1 hypothetical protein ADS79_08635 [Brevibacillus reuszeri]MED1859862.1 hypothetical protein [Brevibacillus reuszeri]GED70936.1 hypothetical protein BRE01_46380 [Brevibacillus reuszeri]
MTREDKLVLVALYRAFEEKKDTHPIYNYFLQQEKVDEFLRILIRLEQMGFVTTPTNAWTYVNSLPYDVVMSAVIITYMGKQVARKILRQARERSN